jgi:signal transduction histidine kinase
MQQTGLGELDELVDRLNAAARSVEDREDAITGRIQVVQEMARIVAHEIRNPLQSLELLTSLIAQEEDDTERHEIADAIHNEIRTLEQVVNRLLRESAMRGSLRLRIGMHAAAPLARQVLALRRPQANRRGVRLTSGPLSQTRVPMDQTLIKRSIENLVLNALQAVPERYGEVRVSVTDEAEWLLICVEDNGPGVDPEVGDAIFEPKVTSKETGTGLGLALVKGVVEAHSGYIRYGESSLGGARFEARIPLTQREEEDGEATPDDPGGG